MNPQIKKHSDAIDTWRWSSFFTFFLLLFLDTKNIPQLETFTRMVLESSSQTGQYATRLKNKRVVHSPKSSFLLHSLSPTCATRSCFEIHSSSLWSLWGFPNTLLAIYFDWSHSLCVFLNRLTLNHLLNLLVLSSSQVTMLRIID